MPLKQLKSTDLEAQFKKLKIPCNKHGLIMFYQNSCPHCQDAKPVLKKFGKNNNVGVFLVECSGNNFKILKSLDIEAVPEIRYVTPKGKITKQRFKDNVTQTKLKKFLLSKVKK